MDDENVTSRVLYRDLEKINLWAWQSKMQFNANKREEVILSCKAPFTRERNRSVPFFFVPKSVTLRCCIHTGTLQMTSYRSEKWSDNISDTRSGTVRNRSVPFPCERAKLVQKRNDMSCALGACVRVVVVGSKRSKMEDFKNTIGLLAVALASLTALLKLNIVIVSFTKLAYRQKRNLLLNLIKRKKRRHVLTSQTILAT